MAASTTTLKLTDKQVQALIYAMNIADAVHEGYDSWERKELGHAAKEQAWAQIFTKLEKEGWR